MVARCGLYGLLDAAPILHATRIPRPRPFFCCFYKKNVFIFKCLFLLWHLHYIPTMCDSDTLRDNPIYTIVTFTLGFLVCPAREKNTVSDNLKVTGAAVGWVGVLTDINCWLVFFKYTSIASSTKVHVVYILYIDI